MLASETGRRKYRSQNKVKAMETENRLMGARGRGWRQWVK